MKIKEKNVVYFYYCNKIKNLVLIKYHISPGKQTIEKS